MNAASFAKLCVGVAIAFAAGGCDDWKSPDENMLMIQSDGGRADGSRTFAVAQVGKYRYALELDDPNTHSARFKVRDNRGIINVRFYRIVGTSDTIGRGEVTMEIVKGYTYAAIAGRRAAKAETYCFGCTGVVKFPLTGSAVASTDSLHVLYTHSLPLCRNCVSEKPTGQRTLVASKQ